PTTAPQCPYTPLSRSRSTAENASPTGSNCHWKDCVKSRAGCASATRCGQSNASEIGSFIEGGEACAIVEPSTNVAIEWMMDCGCTVTSISEASTSKSKVASMSSRPLFTKVAEFNVFICPIDHVGCAAACCGVTSHICSRVQPRNGPPEAVSTNRANSPRSPERKH